MMKKLLIKSDKPMFYRVNFFIEPVGFNWDVGMYKGFHGSWENKEQEAMFRNEVKEKLSFGDFSTFENGDRFVCDKIVRNEDKRQYIYCYPTCITYTGQKDGLDALTDKMNKGGFTSFSYLHRTIPIKIYDMNEDELKATLDANTAIIKDNIREHIKEYPSGYKYEIVDNVFEFVRFPNTCDDFSYSENWCSDELAYKKTLDIFNGMVNNNEITRDENNQFVINEHTNEDMVKKSLKVPVNKVLVQKEVEYGR